MSIFLLIVYVASVRFSYKFFQRAYSKGGRWDSLNSNLLDVFFTIIPFVNTIATIYFSYDEYINEKEFTFNKFFRVSR